MMKNFLWGFLAPALLFSIWEITLQTRYQDKVDKAHEINGVPAVGPLLFLTQNYDSDILPLGGIANKKTVLCRENSGWTMYQADSHGFANPESIWQEKNIDIAFIGDSYIQGACVPDGKSFVNLMREQYKVLNLSSFGHGPLSQLGLVLEYLPKIKPKNVIISYVPNDLYSDLSLEINSPKLQAYLQGNIQQLDQKQDQIDEAYEKFIALKSQNIDKPVKGLHLVNYFRSKNLEINRTPPKNSGYPTDYQNNIPPEFFELYWRILNRMQESIKTWNGKLYVLNIPDAGYFATKNNIKVKAQYDNLRMLVQSTGAQWIDLSKMFDNEKNPYEFYAPLAGYYGHFNELGQTLAKEYIEKTLN